MNIVQHISEQSLAYVWPGSQNVDVREYLRKLPKVGSGRLRLASFLFIKLFVFTNHKAAVT